MNTLTPEILTATFEYVSRAPYFWLTMGMVTAVSMFIGAIVFDGDLPTATKGIIGVLSYVFFLIQVQFTRVTDAIPRLKPPSPSYTWHAATVTIIIMTLFWMIGVLLGVYTSYMVRMRYKLKV